jgi:thiamine biosynthesis protein ThiS
MEIKLNGKLVRVPLDGATSTPSTRTVADLLAERGLKAAMVAVEHNGVIVPRAEFERREIADGDTLEIVHFVGGG